MKMKKYLSRLEKAQDEVVKMMEKFLFEKNNSETKEKIVNEITRCFKENEIITDTLEDAGWEVSFYESKGRFNNISITLKTTIEISFHFKGGEK